MFADHDAVIPTDDASISPPHVTAGVHHPREPPAKRRRGARAPALSLTRSPFASRSTPRCLAPINYTDESQRPVACEWFFALTASELKLKGAQCAIIDMVRERRIEVEAELTHDEVSDSAGALHV